MNMPRFVPPLFLLVVLVQAGCSAVIRPTVGASEFLVNERKFPGDVALYVPDEFRTYSWAHTDAGDLKLWKLELGAATTDALRYALESRFDSVTVRASRPRFPLAPPGPSLAVVPTFDSVKVATPVVFKFENYRVALTLSLRVYDAAGNELESMILTGEGRKAGSIGYESAGHAALPEACHHAIKQVADQAVRGLIGLAARQRT